MLPTDDGEETVFVPRPEPSAAPESAESAEPTGAIDRSMTPPNSQSPTRPSPTVSTSSSSGLCERIAIPSYALLEELGRGGMGVVFRARHTTLGWINAIKLVLSTASSGDAARFCVEAEAIAAIRHDNVVRVHGFGVADGRSYLVMDFVEGGNLHQKLKREGRLPPKEAAELAVGIARGVQAAHDSGVVHRDLKPANILIGIDGIPRVGDFGLAKRLGGATITLTDSLLGTPSWMSPEQASSDIKGVGPATDIWATGVILYECITGVLPFRGDDALAVLKRVADDEPASLRGFVPDLSRDLELICLKCLRKNPRQRYASAEALADDLGRWLRREPVSVRPPTSAERAIRWVQRNPSATRLIAIGAVTGALIVALVLKNRWDLREAAEARDLGAVRAALMDERLQRAEDRQTDAEQTANAQKFGRFLAQARNLRLAARPGWTWATRDVLQKATALPHDAALDDDLRDEYVASLTIPDAREVAHWPLPKRAEDSRYLAVHPTRPLLAVCQFGYPGLDEGLPPKLSVWLLDTTTGRIAATLKAPTDVFSPHLGGRKESPSGLGFSPDGRWLVMTARSGHVHRWDLSGATPGPVASFDCRERGGEIAFSPDGRRLYFGTGKFLEAVDTRSWKPLASRFVNELVRSINPVPGTDRVIAVAANRVVVLDPHDLSELAHMKQAMGYSHLSIADDGRTGLLADGAQVNAFDANTRTRTGAFDYRSPPGTGSSVPEPSPDSRFAVFSQSSTRVLGLYELRNGRRLCNLPVPNRAEHPPIAFAPDSKTMYVGGRNEIRVFDLAGGGRIAAAQPWPITRIGTSPDGRTLRTAAGHTPQPDVELSEISLWSATKIASKPLSICTLPFGGSVHQFASLVSPTVGGWIVGGSGDRGFAWDPARSDLVQFPISPTRSGVYPVCFGPDGHLWVGGEGATASKIVSPGGLRATDRSYVNPGNRTVSGEPTASMLVGGRSGVLCSDGVGGFAWLDEKGTPISRWREANSPTSVLALSPDERLVLVGLASGVARVYKLATGERVAAWQAHGEAVSAACWVGTGTIATGSGDRTVSLWRYDRPAPKRLLTIPTVAAVRDLAAIDGSSLAVLEADSRSVNVIDLKELFDALSAQKLGFDDLTLPAPSNRTDPEPAAEAPPTAGMRADYYRTANETSERVAHLLTRIEPAPGNDWGSGSPHPYVAADRFSVCYRGWLKAPKPGRYVLTIDVDDGAEVFLDGVQVGVTVTNERKEFPVDLDEKAHRLRIDYQQDGLNAHLTVLWSQPGTFAARSLAGAVFADRDAADRAVVTIPKP